ncbi:transcriptional regulator family: Fungal Specific TF [Penicillium waksmanii]|uniref:transcriptional regulator family: Fungal Specific TF n=1 Tax=Penicillium waksmanii TaxID=69791 RepID=UPI0025473447|nr:transcriptional regulator family: Fungal Specific TF [Penicillium waksmanii]KAJ5983273.1 transcriptional regulator family: Fungal Specific TF [Penicillium waksmanii]
MNPPTKRSGRIGSTKSKTGCNTCKIRRVRCGEEKPHCARCISTGRQCHYSTASKPRTTQPLLPLQLTLSSHSGSRERRAFEYYFHRAGPSLSGVLDVSFWRGSVLQICRLEPAVWDAVISLSTLYERPPIHESPAMEMINDPAVVRQRHHREALVWYSRSLAALQQRIEQGSADLNVSLISCILFIAIELLQGNRRAAVNLYKQGVRMVLGVQSAPMKSLLLPIFRRLGTWALIVEEKPDDCWDLNPTVSYAGFASIDDARNVLCGIVAEMKTLDVDAKVYWKQTHDARRNRSPVLVARQNHLAERLEHWYRLFHALERMQISTLPGNVVSNDGAIALLLMTYTSVLIEIKTCLDPDQTAYDAYEAEFAQILDLAPVAIASTRLADEKQPPFMFEMGVFLPLFITALKCPFPQLRRRALHFLSQAPPAQGLFMCGPAADAVAVIVTLEENPATTARSAAEVKQLLAQPGCIPAATDRTCSFGVSSELDGKGKVLNWLHYSLRYFDGEGRMQLKQKSIPFPDLHSPT